MDRPEQHGRRRTRAWYRDPELLLFIVLILVHLFPLWYFDYFPSQDGPAHLNNANVIRSYNLPQSEQFRKYYQLSPHPEPNWSGHLILAGLTWLVSPLTAEKVLLGIYVLLFPLLLRYALVQVRPDAGFLAILVFPFIYGYPLHLGLYNFSLGLALFFLPLGYVLKHGRRFNLRHTVLLALLLIVLYFSHFIALLAAGLAIGILTLWQLAAQWVEGRRSGEAGGPGELLRLFRRCALGPLAALLPVTLLAAAFLERQGARHVAGNSIRQLALEAAGLFSLVSFHPREQFCTWPLAAVFFTVAAGLFLVRLGRRELGRKEGLLAAAVAFGLVYLLAPAKISGGAVINERLMLFPFLLLILWFGTAAWRGAARIGLQAAAALIALTLFGMHTRDYARVNDYLDEYLSGAELIEPRSTLLALSFSHQGHTPEGRVLTRRFGPFIHASGYIAAQRDVVDLKNYEASTGHFPVVYRPELDPYTHIGVNHGLERQPPQVDFIDYDKRTGGSVDYVLLWRIRDRQRFLEPTLEIFRQLKLGYELIFTSEQRGYMQLWRRKNLEVVQNSD